MSIFPRIFIQTPFRGLILSETFSFCLGLAHLILIFLCLILRITCSLRLSSEVGLTIIYMIMIERKDDLHLHIIKVSPLNLILLINLN